MPTVKMAPKPGLALCPVALPRRHLVTMIRTVRCLYALSHSPRYQHHIDSELPEVARFDPGHDAVMMGYDFHLSGQGPRLIEVNTNAGGGLLAYRTRDPERPPEGYSPSVRIKADLLKTFSEEMRRWSAGAVIKPRTIVILDATPEKQFLYPEMEVLSWLFDRWGIRSAVADPAELNTGATGEIFLRGEPVEMIYNRHCDFYLESPEMAIIREAYLARKVCLTPNPRAYGLLADKRRLILWSDPTQVERGHALSLLAEIIPETRLLADCDPAEIWADRKQWVLKPVTRYGSRGVLLGKRMTRKRFSTLPPETTLAQRLVAPSLTPCEEEGEIMKTDFRLFVYRDRILGVAARIYRGQVTNFRETGSGYAPVKITPD